MMRNPRDLKACLKYENARVLSLAFRSVLVHEVDAQWRVTLMKNSERPRYLYVSRNQLLSFLLSNSIKDSGE